MEWQLFSDIRQQAIENSNLWEEESLPGEPIFALASCREHFPELAQGSRTQAEHCVPELRRQRLEFAATNETEICGAGNWGGGSLPGGRPRSLVVSHRLLTKGWVVQVQSETVPGLAENSCYKAERWAKILDVALCWETLQLCGSQHEDTSPNSLAFS